MRMFSLSASPGKLLLIFAALVFSGLLGLLLDWFWRLAGEQSVLWGSLALPYSAAPLGLWTRLGQWFAGFADHPVYALCFFLPSLVVWSLLCGAVCRMNALEFGMGRQIDVADGVSFARRNLLTGFLAAPLMPAVFVVALGVLLLIGGLVLSIPWFGDIVGGLLFPLAMVVGLLIAYLIVGSVLSATLFWPAVATDGYDGTECVTHCISYVQNRPVRTLWYWLVSAVVIGVAMYLLTWFVWLGLSSTHRFVGYGTDVFTNRGAESVSDSKLDSLWTVNGPSQWFGPAQYDLHNYEKPSRGLIAFWVALLGGLMWALFVNLWLAAGTIAYFLLRREIDEVDDDEVYEAGESEDILVEEVSASGSTETVEAGSSPPPGEGA